MRLLVSVATAMEARAAVEGGADLIDAKDPHAGALGAVTADTLGEIHAAVGAKRPVTASLGDAEDEADVERLAREFAARKLAFVKVGFAGISSLSRIASLTKAAVRGARPAGVVAVAYADRPECVTPLALVDTVAGVGVDGLLIDTADKRGPGLCRLAGPRVLAHWTARAHEAGLFVALAGQLEAEDLRIVIDAGADIAGVRGAACIGGRTGQISAERIRELRERAMPPVTASLST